jgi:hypothetical protein
VGIKETGIETVLFAAVGVLLLLAGVFGLLSGEVSAMLGVGCFLAAGSQKARDNWQK